mmetsp:Transcript_106988/g.269079  ORF Transcript_106988/g.269079 Transcript_106988/m.269079 type:complete len:403 (+) Transcript_106988:292-1500(+)
MLDLYADEGLQYSQDVLLEECLVEVLQVEVDDRILVDLLLVLRADLFELFQRPVLQRRGDGRHGVDLRARVLQPGLAVDDRARLRRSVLHDLRQQLVLQSCLGLLVLGRVEGLEGLVEVGEGGPVVLLPGGEDARPQIDLCLEQWRAVDRVGIRLRRGERCLGLRQVLHGVVRAALQKVDFDEEELVVQLLDLNEQLLKHFDRLCVLEVLQVEPREPRLDALPQEGALLALAPLDAVLAHVDLQVHRVWGLRENIDEHPDDLRRLGLGQVCEHGAELLGQRADLAGLLLLDEEVAQGVDGLLPELRVGVLQVLVEDDVFVRLRGLVRRLRFEVLGFLEQIIEDLCVRHGRCAHLVDLHGVADLVDVHGFLGWPPAAGGGSGGGGGGRAKKGRRAAGSSSLGA